MTLAEVAIESIAAGGDGVGRADGLVVFVPRTAPGDVVQADVTPRGRFARGTVRALVRRSPDRQEPECAHYDGDHCGGCQLQHLRYDAQLAAKGRIVQDALVRIGRRQVGPPPVRPSPSPWRYRRKLTLALRRRGRGWIAGLHPYDAPGRVFALADCLITDERVLEVWRAVMAASDLLPAAAELRGGVRVGDDGASLAIEGGDAWPASARFFERVPRLRELWWRPERGVLSALHARGEARSPGASFAQVNLEVAAALRDYVVERVLAHRPRSVIDAYAGLGDAAAALASAERSVVAIEVDPAAAAWCAGRLPPGSRSVVARVEDALPDALPADVVVLNPPRAGIDARVAATLDAARPATRAVIYVSCDPATLARDLLRLPAWRIASVVAFDMFPQTAHVETVCELVPEET